MKILWVNPVFLDYRVPLYEELYKTSKHEFYVTFSGVRTPSRVKAKMIKALRHNSIIIQKERTFYIGNRHKEMANTHLRIVLPRGLYKTIARLKPDIIIAEGFFQWTPIALWYAVIHKTPIYISYERTKHTERNCPKWRTLYRQFINRFVTGYLCNGSQTIEYLQSMGVTRNKCFPIGMPADSIGIAKKVYEMTEQEKKDLRLNLFLQEGITYLFVGRMIPLKGIKYLLYSWEKHIQRYVNDNLLLIGEGVDLKEFSSQYKKVPSIHFVGGIDYDNIYQYYAISDVFIIPTLEDNWSLVVPEAMACGLPIACSIYNGCYPELVHEDRNGKLFDPLDKETIIETLSYFHGKDLKEMGEESINIEKKYNPNQVAENIRKAIKT